MSRILAQAREYGAMLKEDGNSISALAGDYYGVYSGTDRGTFFFRMDSAGHISGTGRSSEYDIPFLINGQVSTDGLVEMRGDGVAGNARFKGRLNTKTGEIAGIWSLARFGGGEFTGRHAIAELH